MSNWTTDKPTKPGWYWWREKQGEREFIILLHQANSGLWVDNDNWWWPPSTTYFVPDAPGEWSDRQIDPPIESVRQEAMP